MTDLPPVVEIPTTSEPLPFSSPLEPQRPHVHLTPSQWVRQNLVNTPLNTVLSLVFGLGLAWLAYRVLRFVFVSADWEIIRRNLRLFMVGRIDADHLDEHLRRVWISLYLLAAVVGFVAGIGAGMADDAATAAGRPPVPVSLTSQVGRGVRRYWPLIGAAAVVLSFTRTLLPGLLLVGAVATLVLVRAAGRRSRGLGRLRWVIVVVGFVASVVVVAGFGGVSSDQWGGLQLALFATVAGVALSFPLGVLMALGRQAGRAHPSNFRGTVMAVLLGAVGLGFVLTRRVDVGSWATWITFAVAVGIAVGGWVVGRSSSLPVVRLASVAYIELFRGVPLITLLFAGRYIVPLFYPNTVEPPSGLTRALIAIVLFEAAYIAETVRGGLQAIPRGQYEAAEALGMSRWALTRRIVLPQALRAVIPAMVGQFISLFKDTSLLATVGFFELLSVAQTVISQPDFVGQRLHTVTFAFVAMLYWAVSYTMSRESRRIEAQLGVGTR
jgi:general L-amino acid transport system permease protein